jgi:hypothetical protein
MHICYKNTNCIKKEIERPRKDRASPTTMNVIYVFQ